ncbi:MAG: flagellar export chaperone FlgN [Phycisphaeraceae bacterium]|nr:flagellar export chaperone FlgN [Phycisphaeraceae bacterium]MCB9847980.1 flagellar export chaperone FlgN [Phycisphaeraceae bacterium]
MPDRNTAGESIAQAAARLEAMLAELTLEYDRLEKLGAERLSAMRRADLQSVAQTIGAESEIASRIADLDRRRADAAGELGGLLGVAQEQASATTLARRAAGRVGDAVQDAANQLRAVIERVQRQNARAQIAAQTLAAHMQGVIRAAQGRLNHSGAYGARGVVAPGPTVVSTLDLVS